MKPKLVRDKIPGIIQKNNQIPITQTLQQTQYRRRLEQKLQEEVNEFIKSKSPEELADILEVVYSLGLTLQISPTALEKIRQQKRKTRGGFEKMILLSDVTTLDKLYSEEFLNQKIDYQSLDRFITTSRVSRAFSNHPTNKDFLLIYHCLDWSKLHNPSYLESINHLRGGLGISSLGSIKRYVEKVILQEKSYQQT